jgi:FMN phosphatase YigB (HAD superfamily)
VFDTFLLRACTTSQGVYERAFQLSPVAKSHPNAAEVYVQHRIQANNLAYKAKDKRPSFEVTIEDIYKYFPFRLFGLDSSAKQSLIDAEFQAELDLCRVNEEVLRLYRREQNAGHRVGFISDTYWGEERIAALLQHCEPGLTWDFLYASCDHGTSKSDRLFARYLAGQRIDPDCATHLGDNPEADIKSARKHRIRPRFYPQADRTLASIFERETSTFSLLCDQGSARLDNGYRTLRRIVSARSPQRSQAFRLGLATIGPAMMAFDRFLADRISQHGTRGNNVAVAFLGRDGFLSHRIWTDAGRDNSCFLEISRRVTLVASATTLEPLIDLFKKIGEEKIDAQIVLDILKILPQSIAAFFAAQPGRRATGYQLAKALPSLVRQKDIAGIAATVRRSLLTYLESKIPNLKHLSDLVVVDIGYSGSIQKSLRRIFDIEKLNIKIHGLYLSTHDDAFYDLHAEDSAEGFISDLVFTPHVKRMFNRSATVIEQICCSTTGSVRSYGADNEVFYEPDGRSKEQIATALDVQDGALAFIKAASEVAASYRLAPFDDLDMAAKWSATILARLLLLPTDSELTMLGAFRHDLNLGSQAIVSMVDRQFVSNLEIARGFPIACMAPAPPMWLSGSFASLTPANAYLYMLFGANRLPSNVFGEIKCATLQVGLFGKDGSASMEDVAVYRTANSDLRIRIPIAQSMKLDTIAIPVAKIVKEGVLRGVTVQHGKTIQAVTLSSEVADLPLSDVAMAGFERHGRYFRAIDPDACAILKLGTMPQPVMVLTLAISPLDGNRIVAADDAEDFEDDLKAALFSVHHDLLNG